MLIVNLYEVGVGDFVTCENRIEKIQSQHGKLIPVIVMTLRVLMTTIDGPAE
jgi:hypothetical protein